MISRILKIWCSAAVVTIFFFFIFLCYLTKFVICSFFIFSYWHGNFINFPFDGFIKTNNQIICNFGFFSHDLISNFSICYWVSTLDRCICNFCFFSSWFTFYYRFIFSSWLIYFFIFWFFVNKTFLFYILIFEFFRSVVVFFNSIFASQISAETVCENRRTYLRFIECNDE